jgi:rhodanese-related sulfurtransferase
MTMRRVGRPVALLIGVVMLLAACGGDSSTGVLDTVPALEAASVLDSRPDAVLLDIRTPQEFAEGRIAGSVNIDFYEADFRSRLDALDRDTTYVVYCRSGNRSDSAMDIFTDLGFTSVYEVDGGIISWVNSGLPIGG